MAPDDLKPLPVDWRRALVLMAHPDDPEYGIAAAVAEWTGQGKEVAYVLATRGEAGIAGLPPGEAGPLREQEQRAACQAVGVKEVSFLDYPDGRLEESLQLRSDLAREIRTFRPEVVVTLNHRDTWGPGAWNSQDHQVMGRSVLNAVADAANEWIFPELAEQGHRPHTASWTAVASTRPTHYLDVGQQALDCALRSLSAHRRYLEALSNRPVGEQAAEQLALVTGGRPRISFEIFGM